MSTNIEWTEHTPNPVVGCDKVSPGCKNCYAIRMAYRLMHSPNKAIAAKYAGTVAKTAGGQLNWTGRLNFDISSMTALLRKEKPTINFVNSMGDLFHEDVPFEFLDQVFAIIALTPQHTYQVLTKRVDRMLEYFSVSKGRLSERWESAVYKFANSIERSPSIMTQTVGCSLRGMNAGGLNVGWPMKNLWLGVSVEDQKTADERIFSLLQIPSAVHFLSCEPLIGSVNLDRIKGPIDPEEPDEKYYFNPFVDNSWEWEFEEGRFDSVDGPTYSQIDWVIVGGESGPGARPMHPDWVRSLRDQCEAAGIAFFFKQWGEWLPSGQEPDYIEPKYIRSVKDFMKDGNEYTGAKTINAISDGLAIMYKVGKKKAGRLLDGTLHNDYPTTSNNQYEQKEAKS